jgi:hypothetical protein
VRSRSVVSSARPLTTLAQLTPPPSLEPNSVPALRNRRPFSRRVRSISTSAGFRSGWARGGCPHAPCRTRSAGQCAARAPWWTARSRAATLRRRRAVTQSGRREGPRKGESNVLRKPVRVVGGGGASRIDVRRSGAPMFS